MNAETLLFVLLRFNVVASVAIIAVLALRPWVLRRLGAAVVYWLWLVVPLAVAVSAVPARERVARLETSAAVSTAKEFELQNAANDEVADFSQEQNAVAQLGLPQAADVLVAVWLLGAAALLARSIVSTRRLARDPAIGPALIGVLRPRLVLPDDFATRFDAHERALILAHEDHHRVSGHTLINALVELVRCVCWFNPLVHAASVYMRIDQELACDAAVIAAHPTSRRAYAQALLKTQVWPVHLTLGCAWTTRSGKRLSDRIALLAAPSLTRCSAALGGSLIAGAGLALGYGAWAQQPERIITESVAVPEAVWTPSAAAPAGVLSHELEERRHDSFIERAEKGNIDLVFFGTTDTEMWRWPDRGRSVWDRAFGALNAACFGSQGTHTESLVWRLQNGELAGYRAKLVVLQTWGAHGDPSVAAESRDDAIATYGPVISEIRSRQPQAKILLQAPIPRGQTDLAGWREHSAANAEVLARLVDNDTVFYADFGESFFLPDGTHNQALWRFPPLAGMTNVGIQTAGFEVWAEALQPWIQRFVR